MKRYEEELRDPTEYLLWQKDIKDKDNQIKLDLIEQRKIQTRLSHKESHGAIAKQKEENKMSADLQREQADMSAQEKELNRELKLLSRRDRAPSAIAMATGSLTAVSRASMFASTPNNTVFTQSE